MPAEPSVEVRPIARSDVAAVAEFLHRELNPRVTEAAWASGITARWAADAPNHGFMLTASGVVVGANLVFYSTRDKEGQTERFANLGALCVVEPHRAHVLRLLRAVLRQPGYHFTDFSPSGNVVELNRRLGFRVLETDTGLLPGRPLVPSRSLEVISDLGTIEKALTGRDQQLFDDHRDAPAARHLLLTQGSAVCYVISRRVREKRLPLFMAVLHVSDADMFRRGARQVAHHHLVRAGAIATLLETRVSGPLPPGAMSLGPGRPKMVRAATGSELEDADVDYLYSELTQIAW